MSKLLKKVRLKVWFDSEDELFTAGFMWDNIIVNERGKESCNRPGVAQRVPGGLGSQIS
jgi:hypothetical protein